MIDRTQDEQSGYPAVDRAHHFDAAQQGDQPLRQGREGNFCGRPVRHRIVKLEQQQHVLDAGHQRKRDIQARRNRQTAPWPATSRGGARPAVRPSATGGGHIRARVPATPAGRKSSARVTRPGGFRRRYIRQNRHIRHSRHIRRGRHLRHSWHIRHIRRERHGRHMSASGASGASGTSGVDGTSGTVGGSGAPAEVGAFRSIGVLSIR